MTLNPALADAKYCPRCGRPPRSPTRARSPARTAATAPTTTRSRWPPRSRSPATGDIVLLRRGFDPGKDLWTFPGGFVDLGETVEEAAQRETREEIQADVELTDLVGRVLARRRAGRPHRLRRPIEDEPQTTAEALQVQAFAPDEIPWEELAFWSTTNALKRLPRALLTLRRAVALAAVVVATLAGGYLALVSFRQDRVLSVGTIRLSVSPGHQGALDIYVPLVDWGARFEAIPLPARLRIDLRTVDRNTVKKVADGAQIDVDSVREGRARPDRHLPAQPDPRRAAVRGVARDADRVRRARRRHAGAQVHGRTALGTAIIVAAALVLFLPPRGQIDKPQYYAFGPDIPRALERGRGRAARLAALDQELNAQLVGLARLVIAPANRRTLDDRPRFTLASDLHNNIFAIPILERTAAKGPVFFPGDLTDRGSPIEASLTRRVINVGRPFVFSPGNHDSDQLANGLAREGAIVLTRTGRLDGKGDTTGRPIVNVKGIRVAGYDDPYERHAGEGFADLFRVPGPDEIERFATWLRPIRDDVDIVMVHNPALLPEAVRELDAEHRAHPLLFLVGHTHHSSLTRTPGATIINSGTVGAGGTGSLLKHLDVGIARVTYEMTPRFTPLAVDQIEIDPRSGNATARRERLDEPVDG